MGCWRQEGSVQDEHSKVRLMGTHGGPAEGWCGQAHLRYVHTCHCEVKPQRGPPALAGACVTFHQRECPPYRHTLGLGQGPPGSGIVPVTPADRDLPELHSLLQVVLQSCGGWAWVVVGGPP